MDTIKQIVRAACIVTAIASVFVASYHAKRGDFDKAAYWMAFAAFMATVA